MKRSQIFLFIAILASLFMCNSSIAQQKKVISGIVIENYETKDGTIIIQYPEKLTSGKIISGKVIVQSKSKKPSKKAKQIESLYEHILIFGKNIPIKDGIFVTKLPKQKTIAIGIANTNGEKVGESITKLTNPPDQKKLKIPGTIKANNIEIIEGDFPGDVTLATLSLDDVPVEIIAGNESQLFYKVDNLQPGKHTLDFDYGNQKHKQEVNLIDYTLAVDKTTLNRGEKANLNVKIMGLKDISDPVKLTVENNTIGTVSLQGGQVQDIEIYPVEVRESGVWEKEFEIISIKRGTFTLSTNLIILDGAEVAEIDSLADFPVLEELIEPENPEEKKDKKNKGIAGTENLDPEMIDDPDRNRPELPEPAPPPKPRKRCVNFGYLPEINDRTGWDLIGDLYADGTIDSDYLNDMRAGDLWHKVQGAKILCSSLQTILSENNFKAYKCSNSLAHLDDPQVFPEFPWEDIFLSLDLCDATIESKTKLTDFLDPNCDLEALKKWRSDFGKAIQNFGISGSGYDNMLGSFSEQTAKSMENINKAYDTFQEDMRVTLALRYNASRARGRMWEAVAFTVGTALSVVTGGGSAALAAVLVSTSGFVLEQGMTTMGMDENIAQLVTAVTTAGIGATDIIIGSSTAVVSEGINTMSQKNAENYAMSMAMLDDDVWAKMIENLSEDYRVDAINQFNVHRNRLIGAVKEELAELCKMKNSMEKLLPETEKALKDAEAWVSSSFWRNIWKDGLDNAFDCCCEYSDGSGPSSSCKQTIPPFGFDPDEFLLRSEQRKK